MDVAYFLHDKPPDSELNSGENTQWKCFRMGFRFAASRTTGGGVKVIELLSGRNRRVEVEKDPIDCNQVHQEEYCSGASTLWTKPSPLLLTFFLYSPFPLAISTAVLVWIPRRCPSGQWWIVQATPLPPQRERGDVYWTLTLSRELQMISAGDLAA
ncbi:hypothetical protein CEXT_256181 [Caerostris extrusa]|uniref:Uncharacterized protein n=1 Tax=Caerostris extrusa TaxID=172846 RepID=A0AAV4QTS1_CAEEX|nr:hypothetical protein CEXT_256181 [Caerostris extrusa]